MTLRALSALALALLASACSPTHFVNALASRDGYTLHSAAYGQDPRQQLDIYQPTAAQFSHAAPIIVFFYGGSWQNGDRADYRFAGAALASQGFVVVIPDYRVYPQVQWPTFLQDSAQATEWAHAHAAEYGANPHKLFLMGHSAGAYNAAMLALDRQYLDAQTPTPWQPAGLIGLAGPYDFLPLTDPKLIAVFGQHATDPATQPITHASKTAPPALLITGDADRIVNPANTTALAAKLRSLGVPVEEHHYPDIGHLVLAGSLTRPFRGQADTLEKITTFVKACCAGPS